MGEINQRFSSIDGWLIGLMGFDAGAMTPEFLSQKGLKPVGIPPSQGFLTPVVLDDGRLEQALAHRQTSIRVRLPDRPDREKTLERLVSEFKLAVTLQPVQPAASGGDQEAWLDVALSGFPHQIRHALIYIDGLTG